jgi:hypothetical protein
MLRLCSESSRSYPGRSVRHAAFDVSFYHSVKLPVGATGLPSPGDIVRASRLISRNKTKRSYSGLVNMRHYKAALYGITRKVTGQKSAEAIVAKCLF